MISTVEREEAQQAQWPAWHDEQMPFEEEVA